MLISALIIQLLAGFLILYALIEKFVYFRFRDYIFCMDAYTCLYFFVFFFRSTLMFPFHKYFKIKSFITIFFISFFYYKELFPMQLNLQFG